MLRGVRRRRRKRSNGPPSGNQVRLLHDGEQVFPVMLEAIRMARHEVLLEMYWFGSDRTGVDFARALRDKAREGVLVRVIYDAVGSLDASDQMFDELAEGGVEVFEFNPIAPWREHFRFSRIGRRDHRKMLVVDGYRAITGGINIADQWAPKREGGGGFRDDGVEIVGPAARQLRRLFYRTFPKPAPSLPLPEPPVGPCIVRVLARELGHRRGDIYDSYVNAIARAARDITITNSYFIPPRRVRTALARAVERGVRVRVIVPAVSDVPATQLAGRVLYEWMLTRGIQIYEWTGGILHSKTAAIDDGWCTVGTFNFDSLSIHYNLEVNVAMESTEVTGALRERTELDLATAVAIELATFRKRSLFARLLERFCYAFRWMM
jgi:cardiolipin synthase